MSASQVPMWLPRGFIDQVQASPWGGKYCFFDAKQRGDMYHIRAWQVLQSAIARDQRVAQTQGKPGAQSNAGAGRWPPPPTIIYNYVPVGEKGANEATVDYITEIILQETWTFVTRWSWEQLTGHGNQSPTHQATKYDSSAKWNNSSLEWVTMNKELQINPSRCTDDIHSSGGRQRLSRQPPDRKKQFNMIPENMAKFDVNSNPQLQGHLDHSYKTLLPDKDTRARKLGVILWRDTLASGGPYPELNTGAESARQLIDILDSLGLDACFIDVAKNDMPPKVLKGAHCGKDPYFKAAVLDSDLWQGSNRRDREACWVKHAYDKKWFDLVVGLRSGALDSMTFLGIPTVSIGLQYMIGEGRMHSLGGDVFKRTNVDYATPRHPGTKLVQSKYGQDLVFDSPAETPGSVPSGREAALLRGFTPFDERTVRIGILFAATKYVGSKKACQKSCEKNCQRDCRILEPPKHLNNNRLVTSEENRAYWDGKRPDLGAWNSEVQAMEEEDYKSRGERQYRERTQETLERYNDARKYMRQRWAVLRETAVTKEKDKEVGERKAKEKLEAKKRAEEIGKSRADEIGESSLPEPKARGMVEDGGGQKKAEKATKERNAPKRHRNCMAGVNWLCCGVFGRR